jgi:hypothetical protein
MADKASERQGRAAQVATERRRRGDSEFRAPRRLPIPPDIEARLKAEGLTPRWANDEGNRIHQLTVLDDYDVVPGVKPVPIGRGLDGKPIMARLLAKRAEFVAEDRANREKKRRETEKALLRGKVKDAAEADSAPQGPSDFYVAKGTEIGRGNQVIE